FEHQTRNARRRHLAKARADKIYPRIISRDLASERSRPAAPVGLVARFEISRVAGSFEHRKFFGLSTLASLRHRWQAQLDPSLLVQFFTFDPASSDGFEVAIGKRHARARDWSRG